MHQHRYIDADRLALGLRERDDWFASVSLGIARGERAVSAGRGARRGRKAYPWGRAGGAGGPRPAP